MVAEADEWTLQDFGDLLPIPMTVIWARKNDASERMRYRVDFHLLTNQEEMDVLDLVMIPEVAAHHKELAWDIARMAYSVVSINGHKVDESFAELDERLRWIGEKWPSRLLKAMKDAYEDALQEPTRLLEVAALDPNSEAAPLTSGSPSRRAASIREKLLAQNSGPSSESTNTTTPATMPPKKPSGPTT